MVKNEKPAIVPKGYGWKVINGRVWMWPKSQTKFWFGKSKKDGSNATS